MLNWSTSVLAATLLLLISGKDALNGKSITLSKLIVLSILKLIHILFCIYCSHAWWYLTIKGNIIIYTIHCTIWHMQTSVINSLISHFYVTVCRLSPQLVQGHQCLTTHLHWSLFYYCTLSSKHIVFLMMLCAWYFTLYIVQSLE